MRGGQCHKFLRHSDTVEQLSNEEQPSGEKTVTKRWALADHTDHRVSPDIALRVLEAFFDERIRALPQTYNHNYEKVSENLGKMTAV